MATVHPGATISPTKLEIVQGWLGDQDWFDGDAASVKAGTRFSYRFDDPAGEVGVESVLATLDGKVFQLPLTYRNSELEGGEPFFLTHMEHTALGRRWIYFGLGDPVLVNSFVSAIIAGDRSVSMEFEMDGQHQVVDTAVKAWGNGSGESVTDARIDDVDRGGPVTTVHTSYGTLSVPHVLDNTLPDRERLLQGTWQGLDDDVVLATLS